MASQTLVLFMLFLTAVFNPDLMNLFITNQPVISMNAIKILIFLSMIGYTLLLLLVYFINVKLFKQGVNVD